MKGSFEKYGQIVSYDIDEAKTERILKKLIGYYSTYSYYGEGIEQNDDSLIAAPSILSYIADNIIKFEVEDEE